MDLLQGLVGHLKDGSNIIKSNNENSGRLEEVVEVDGKKRQTATKESVPRPKKKRIGGVHLTPFNI